MNPVIEHQLIERLTKGFERSPEQVNALQTSDAELIRCPGGRNTYLALTTDSIAEEILSGLYGDLELAGWTAVMANLSDLAAVGARPIGLVLSEILPDDISPADLERLQLGIRNALAACGTFLLGGDTNSGPHLTLTGCAAGWVDGEPVSRLGARNGDILYISGPMGLGNAFALSRTSGANETIGYRPCARIAEGQIVRRHATACMDTSDGVLATLDQLMRLNGCGFSFDPGWEQHIHTDAATLAAHAHLAPWLMLAGEHGEFELVFTLPPEREECFLQDANGLGWKPLRLGSAIADQQIILPVSDGVISPDTARLRNLLPASQGNITRYIDSLLLYERQLSTRSHQP